MRMSIAFVVLLVPACTEVRRGCEAGQEPRRTLGVVVCVERGAPSDVPTPLDRVTAVEDLGATPCPGGLSLCGEFCRDTQSDEGNCGSCGVRCAAGQICSAGLCVSSSVCLPPRQMCSGSCIDTSTDSSNCGSCGVRCPLGTGCVGGVCVCPAQTTRCGASCVNTQTDRSNCGACGVGCSAGATCVAGVCTAPPIDCSSQTSCGACTPIVGCGWCGATGRCIRLTAGCAQPAACPGAWACNVNECDPRLSQPCTSESDCSPAGSPISSRCIFSPGNGPGSTCAKVCRNNTDCESGCCSATTGGVSVCAHLALCIARDRCSIPAGATTSCLNGGTPSCCLYTDTSSGRPSFTQCDYSFSTPSCARLCSRSRDCSSNCCAFDSGTDLWRCVTPGTNCAPF